MHGGRQLQHERLLFFSDAVFAIAITLLIIDIRLPHVAPGSGNAAVADAFLTLIPHYIGFLLSFFVIGRFWIGHHRIFGLLKDHDDQLIWRNLLFLLSIAVMPFPTSVISEYGGLSVVVMFYAGWLTLAGLLNRYIIAYILKTPALLAAPLSAAKRREFRSGWIPIAAGVSGIIGAACHPYAGIAALAAAPFLLQLGLKWFGDRKSGSA